MSNQAPQLPANGDHHGFFKAFLKWANCQDTKKYTRERPIAIYINSIPDVYTNAQESCIPGTGSFNSFRVVGHDNGDGNDVPPEGGQVVEAVVT